MSHCKAYLLLVRRQLYGPGVSFQTLMSKVFGHTVCTKHAKQWLILQTAVIGTVCLSQAQTLIPHLRLQTDVQTGIFLLSANNCFSSSHFLLSQYIETRINGITVVNIDVKELCTVLVFQQTCFGAGTYSLKNCPLRLYREFLPPTERL